MMAALAKAPIQNIPTSSGGFFSGFARPSATTDYPQQPSGRFNSQRPANGDSVKLGNGFWDKLFGR
jgi:hypothetical protein